MAACWKEITTSFGGLHAFLLPYWHCMKNLKIAKTDVEHLANIAERLYRNVSMGLGHESQPSNEVIGFDLARRPTESLESLSRNINIGCEIV